MAVANPWDAAIPCAAAAAANPIPCRHPVGCRQPMCCRRLIGCRRRLDYRRPMACHRRAAPRVVPGRRTSGTALGARELRPMGARAARWYGRRPGADTLVASRTGMRPPQGLPPFHGLWAPRGLLPPHGLRRLPRAAATACAAAIATAGVAAARCVPTTSGMAAPHEVAAMAASHAVTATREIAAIYVVAATVAWKHPMRWQKQPAHAVPVWIPLLALRFALRQGEQCSNSQGQQLPGRHYLPMQIRALTLPSPAPDGSTRTRWALGRNNRTAQRRPLNAQDCMLCAWWPELLLSFDNACQAACHTAQISQS